MVIRDGEDLSQRRAELPRERLPWVGPEVSCGLDGSRVGWQDCDVGDLVLVEVELGLAGC